MLVEKYEYAISWSDPDESDAAKVALVKSNPDLEGEEIWLDGPYGWHWVININDSEQSYDGDLGGDFEKMSRHEHDKQTPLPTLVRAMRAGMRDREFGIVAPLPPMRGWQWHDEQLGGYWALEVSTQNQVSFRCKRSSGAFSLETVTVEKHHVALSQREHKWLSFYAKVLNISESTALLQSNGLGEDTEADATAVDKLLFPGSPNQIGHMIQECADHLVGDVKLFKGWPICTWEFTTPLSEHDRLYSESDQLLVQAALSGLLQHEVEGLVAKFMVAIEHRNVRLARLFGHKLQKAWQAQSKKDKGSL
jgi:hypothetical protein